MNTYPDLPTSPGSDPKNITKLQIDRAEDGTGRGRSFGSDKSGIPLTHPGLDATQKSTLDAFYAANRLLAISHVDKTDGVTRTCLMVAKPEYKRESGNYWTATVMLEQV